MDDGRSGSRSSHRGNQKRYYVFSTQSFILEDQCRLVFKQSLGNFSYYSKAAFGAFLCIIYPVKIHKAFCQSSILVLLTKLSNPRRGDQVARSATAPKRRALGSGYLLPPLQGWQTRFARAPPEGRSWATVKYILKALNVMKNSATWLKSFRSKTKSSNKYKRSRYSPIH